MEHSIKLLIQDWKSQPLPKASSPTYLVQLAAYNQRQLCALELESELKISQAEKLLRGKK